MGDRAGRDAVKAAAEDIGLTVELRTVSAANYINLFIDPSAREGIDGFITINYPDYADPASLYIWYASMLRIFALSGYVESRLMSSTRSSFGS